MANSCPQRAEPGPGPKGRPSVAMNWPWSDLLTDVVLTSVGGLWVKGRGEGVVWVGEPLCPSVVASLQQVEILEKHEKSVTLQAF